MLPLACVGFIEIFQCCRFAWRQPVTEFTRVVERRPEHCLRCVAELKRMHPEWQLVAAGAFPFIGEDCLAADVGAREETRAASFTDDELAFEEVAERVLGQRLLW